MRFQSPDGRAADITRFGVVRHSRRVSKNGWCMVGFQFIERTATLSHAFSWTEGECVFASEAA